MNYSQFGRSGDALNDYGRLGSASSRRVGRAVILTWEPSYTGGSGCQNLPYKGAKMVQGQRWGVSAYANSATKVSQALARFGEFRPIQQWNGVPR